MGQGWLRAGLAWGRGASLRRSEGKTERCAFSCTPRAPPGIRARDVLGAELAGGPPGRGAVTMAGEGASERNVVVEAAAAVASAAARAAGGGGA